MGLYDAQGGRKMNAYRWNKAPPYTIYAIRNTKTGERYVGSTCDWVNRRKSHRYALRRGKSNKRLQASWDEHGEGCFSFEIIEVVSKSSHALAREKYWMNKFRTME